MSTQPNSEHDLDRTDELPRLDVAEYEAKLAAQSGDTLASTDTWAVQSIRDDEQANHESNDSTVFARFNRRGGAETAKTSDVTLEATRILGRISQLENELATAKTQYDELQAKFDRLTTDFAAKEKEARGLAADNARLAEQRSLIADRVQTLEQQLRDDTAQFERDLAQQVDARAAEQAAATTARIALEEQVAELTTLAGRLREENARLDDETKAGAKLAKTQAELIDQFKQRLTAEEKNSAQLAHLLAAKIAEHATVDKELERRAAKIRSLEQIQDRLDQELDTLDAEHTALQAQLVETREQLDGERAALTERDALLAQRDTRIGQLDLELANSKQSIASLTSERDQALQALASEREAQAQAQQTLSARAQEINQLHGSTEELQARIATLQQQLAASQTTSSEQQVRAQDLQRMLDETQLRRDMLASDVESARARIGQLEHEVATGIAVRQSLETRSTELQSTQDALATTQRELDEVRANLVTKHSELAEREDALRSAQDVVADLRKVNDELKLTAEDATRRMKEAEDRDREREANVLSNAADLAAARRQLGQQLAAVQSMEQAIRARDTLADRLRSELQTSQDERAIMAGQLEKSRARSKSMAREIFARDSQIANLKADLAVHVETLAAIRQDVNRTSTTADLPIESGERILEPVDHDADIIVLNRKTMTIGRTSDNDICIPSKLVSRNHARLLIGPNAVIVEDAGSTNGCFVNDMQVKQQLMREGDVLSIGDLKYRLRTRADNGTRIRDNVIPFADGRHHD